MKGMKGMNKNKIRVMAALWVALAGTLLAQPLPGTGPTRSRIKPWLKNALGELAALKTTNDVKVVSKRITLSYIDPVRATLTIFCGSRLQNSQPLVLGPRS